MTKQIFRSILLVGLLVFLASVIFIMTALFDYFSENQLNQLKMQTALAAQGIENEGAGYFDGLETNNYRITWIDSDGQVKYDTNHDSSTMENHLDREEIRAAEKNDYGESSRYSSTGMERTLYSAIKISDGTFVRVSISQNTIYLILLSMVQPICIVFIITIIISMLLASRLSKSIVKPLNEIRLDAPLSNQGYPEIKPLLKRIDSQQKELRSKEEKLRRQKDEFDIVTVSMKEGLVLVNDKMEILSLNRAAKRLLRTDSRAIGRNLCSIDDALDLSELLYTVLTGAKCDRTFQISDNDYKISASPIIWDSKVSGAVILMVDVTEKEKSEQLRREFTANVSHELKTPLHSISGYAELLKNNLVKPENTKDFYEKIYSEAQRMITLIEDIIRLSRLDEGGDSIAIEEFDLLALAKETADSLIPEALNSKVTVTVTGTPVLITGIRQQVGGIIYNLCDNAIKYNIENGRVYVEIQCNENSAIVTVRDTGIGIPPEHHNRIFERFYRVDKSHSKEVGGTGLGLSIVKHAAKIHKAKIDIFSTPGKGTEISVRFPK